MNALDRVISEQRAFAREREWEQFHTAKNLAMALGGEVGELAEAISRLLVQPDPLAAHSDPNLAEELADVMLYLLRLHDVTAIPTSTQIHPELISAGEHNQSEVVLAFCRLSTSVGRVLEALQWQEGTHEPMTAAARTRFAELLHATDSDLGALSRALGIDPVAAAGAKIAMNATKYPVATSKGRAHKQTPDTSTEPR